MMLKIMKTVLVIMVGMPMMNMMVMISEDGYG